MLEAANDESVDAHGGAVMPWWKACVWLKPSWWREGPDGTPRRITYTKHAKQRAASYGLPVLTSMPTSMTYLAATIDGSVVKAVRFACRCEGREIEMVMTVPIMREYGVVITVYDKLDCSAHGRRSRMSDLNNAQKARKRKDARRSMPVEDECLSY